LAATDLVERGQISLARLGLVLTCLMPPRGVVGNTGVADAHKYRGSQKSSLVSITPSLLFDMMGAQEYQEDFSN
jgi:hypothetical protein